MNESSDLRRGRHVVFNLNAHLVFVTKYRRTVIDEAIFGVMRAAWEVVCREFECELTEANYEGDHVHLLVAYPPKVSLARLVNSLKGVSSRRVRAAQFPAITQALWGDHLWSPSYCAVSCGGAPLEIVKRYVESQRGGARTVGVASPPRSSAESPRLDRTGKVK